MDPSTSKKTHPRLNSYKYHGKDPDERRRWRNQNNVSIRKIKRDEQIQAKRNFQADDSMSDKSEDDREQNRFYNLDDLVIKAKSEDPTIRFDAVRSARKLLSIDRNPPIDQLIQCNFLPIFVEYLTYDQCSDLQFEAAWALTNIASGNSQQTQAVADANAFPYLLRLLHSPHANVCEQAVWALGNLIGDGPRLRDYAIELGVIKPLVEFIQKDIPVTFLRNVTWVLVNLCRHKEPPISLLAVRDILPALHYLIAYTDITILVDCTWALAYLLDCGNNMIQIIIDSGVIPYIIKLLNHNELKIVTAALRAIGNVVTGTDEQTQFVLNHGALAYFPKLLKHQKDKLNKEAVWFLSNITAGNQQQVQAVIDAQLIPDVIRHLQYGDFQTQKEAAWCISNLTMSGSAQQIEYIVTQYVIPPLCNLLQQQDAQIIQVCLDALHNILKQTTISKLEALTAEIEECGGLDKIEHLQNHTNKDIYQQSYEIIEKFFSPETDDDSISTMNQAPTTSNPTNEFSFGIMNSNQAVPDNNNGNNAQFQF
ncbi:unnamed protein product [Rotaria magnacalcarata]|uniref:Importin subunit alpha n=3 Tax=Rotaria magnacalcarata TaxID=392030 RepID=A0A820AVV5_9BILA|nr:unnamed protein product [Rotaria magnacalcarata]CAF1562475.1 unnamed protein product [Rotaria magnacalcarata]CAF2113974.1 unnamed protein product [Rotaria magnacalcarata]CAF2247414.1 unnamed protein product [Rotaria magnacalcarata]CAF2267358.1 unnamed protein product [Rotaria magnacalcarata]